MFLLVGANPLRHACRQEAAPALEMSRIVTATSSGYPFECQ
jgi:hypothetical protein